MGLEPAAEEPVNQETAFWYEAVHSLFAGGAPITEALDGANVLLQARRRQSSAPELNPSGTQCPSTPSCVAGEQTARADAEPGEGHHERDPPEPAG